MKTLRLLSTTAAVLLLGAGAVSAQGMKNDEAPARAPAAQQNAPAEQAALSGLECGVSNRNWLPALIQINDVRYRTFIFILSRQSH
jgi:hypothetical protein